MTSPDEVRKAADKVVVAAQKSFILDYFPGMEAAEDGIRAWLDYIPPLFEWFLQRDETRLDPMITFLEGTYNHLDTTENFGIADLHTRLVDWQGDAAEAFRNDFLIRLPPILINHAELTREVIRGLTVQREIIEITRKDAVKIAEQTVTALQSIERGGSNGLGIAMDILGAIAVVAGAVAAPATGGTSVVATAAFRWALVEAGAGLAGSAIEAAQSVGGGSTVEVLQSMDRSVAELRQSMVDAETKLGDALRSDIGVARANMTDLLPSRPNVIADPHGNLTEFTMPPEFPPPTATRTGGP